MKGLSLRLTYKNDCNDVTEYEITFCGDGDDKVTLQLNDNQFSLIQSRFCRSFYIRCRKGKILTEIERAKNYKELEVLAQKYYFCDACDFSEINIYGTKRALNVITEVLYKYPKLRSKFCYIGTHSGFERLLKKLKDGDIEVLNRFNLQYICSFENAKQLGSLAYNSLQKLMAEHDSYIATAMCVFGLFDAILLDQNDYEGYAYIQSVSDIRNSEVVGFHPKGCNSPESIVYHEVGHLLDDMCEFAESEELDNFYKKFTNEEIKDGLSEYALTSKEEFIAEAFAECMCSQTPREIAKTTMQLLNKFYNEL